MDPLSSRPLRVLVVCRANVCRSPLAHAVLATRLAAAVEVTSAGTAAAVGAPPCPDVVDALGADAQALPQAAQQLTRDHVLAADLVLGADRATCAEVIALAPAARARVLTLRELPAVASVALETVAPTDPHALLAALADARAEAWRRASATPAQRSLLGRLRGRVGAARTGGTGRPGSSGPAGWDLPDGHTIDARTHRATVTTGLETARSAADVLADVLQTAR